MKLSTVQCGDEIMYKGEAHVVIKDSKIAGPIGEAATLATVTVMPSKHGEVREDGVLEFGAKGYGRDLVPDVDVPVLRNRVPFHSAAHRTMETEGGRLALVGTGYTPAEAECAELDRCRLKRQRLQTEAEQENAWLRERVRRAIKKGVPVAQIAERSGLSRERIYQIRDGRR